MSIPTKPDTAAAELAASVERFIEHDNTTPPDGRAYIAWFNEWERRLAQMRKAVRQYRRAS
jgi:hypothetical protein